MLQLEIYDTETPHSEPKEVVQTFMVIFPISL